MNVNLEMASAVNQKNSSVIVAKDVRLRISDELHILAGIDLVVNAGEFVALVGPSGCGKTTFLNMIAGLQGMTSGTLEVMGKAPITGHKDIAYALARDALLPWRTALGNVELRMQIHGVSKDERRERALNALERVGLGDASTRYPAQLSQGMRQRVALARTLVTEPRLLILDEPFAALDAQTRIKMQEQLLALLKQYSGTIVMVTHDIAEALTLANRVIVFSNRPARILRIYEVNFGDRNRSSSELRADPAFGRLFEQIWGDIEHGL